MKKQSYARQVNEKNRQLEQKNKDKPPPRQPPETQSEEERNARKMVSSYILKFMLCNNLRKITEIWIFTEQIVCFVYIFRLLNIIYKSCLNGILILIGSRIRTKRTQTQN